MEDKECSPEDLDQADELYEESFADCEAGQYKLGFMKFRLNLSE